MSDLTIQWPGQSSPQAGAETKKKAPAVVFPEAAKALRAFGDDVFIHASAAELRAVCGRIRQTKPTGYGPDPQNKCRARDPLRERSTKQIPLRPE
jgi:hypothetical protein